MEWRCSRWTRLNLGSLQSSSSRDAEATAREPTMVKINFVSVALDSSGYGNFGRDWTANLHKNGVDVAVELISWESQKPTYGTDGDIIKELSKKRMTPDV